MTRPRAADDFDAIQHRVELHGETAIRPAAPIAPQSEAPLPEPERRLKDRRRPAFFNRPLSGKQNLLRAARTLES